MQAIVLLCLSLLLSYACSSRSTRVVAEDDSFGLDDAGGPDRVDDKGYFKDLERSEAAVAFESSFPLPFMVNKSMDLFEDVPLQAKAPPASQLTIHLGECRFSVKTVMVQVDRYILAGQWIRLSEGLPAKVPVRLEPHMDLNLKLVSKLSVEIPSAQLPICQKLLGGKRLYLGRYHLNQTKIGLLTGPGYPRVVFSSRSMEAKGKKIFIRWPAGTATPTLIDDFDFPATSESGIFRAFMGDKGYYYLVIQPVLRMDQMDQLVIKMPLQGFPEPHQEEKVKGPRPKRKKPATVKEGGDGKQQ